MINRGSDTIVRFFDTTYIARFLLRLLGFYLLFRLANWLWIGFITPAGYYSEFLDNYLDYVSVIKASILKTGRLIAQLLGVFSQPLGDSILQVQNGGQVRMAWACCGLEIMSFWTAFVLADTISLRKKSYWAAGGLVAIWMINCLRIALLVIGKQKEWHMLLDLDQHDLFNIVAYLLVVGLMFVYYKRNNRVLGNEVK
jgi:exosortase/archaeosortase family protein